MNNQRYYSDKPISDKKDDLFNRSKFAEDEEAETMVYEFFLYDLLIIDFQIKKIIYIL